MSRMCPIRAISMAVLAVALVLSSGALAAAGVPTDQLKGSIERVLKTTAAPPLAAQAEAPPSAAAS